MEIEKLFPTLSGVPHETSYTIKASWKHFSNLFTLSDDDETLKLSKTFHLSDKSVTEFVSVKFYPNGGDKSSEGTISVQFTALPRFRQKMELICVISVIDAEDNKRFSKSIVICIDEVNDHEPNQHFIMDNYISHRVLLKEPLELLPGDVLTLHVDAVLRAWDYFMHSQVRNETLHSTQPLKYQTDLNGSQEVYLCLDSCIGKLLLENSIVFKRFLVSPMKEKDSRGVMMPFKEIPQIDKIEAIFLHNDPITFSSVSEIYDLYAFADKYDIPIVVDTCRSWIQLCLDSKNAPEISKFAHLYNDDCMKEAVRDFLKKEHQPEVTSDGDQRPVVSVNKEWIFKKRVFDTSALCFSLNLDKTNRKDIEKEFYNFYS